MRVFLARLKNHAPRSQIIEDHRHEPAGDLRLPNASRRREREHKNHVVERRRHQRQNTEAKQQNVNPHGIENRTKVRTAVVVHVNCPYGDLRDAAALMLNRHEHVQFKFVPGRGHPQQMGNHRRRNPPESGLAVGEVLPHRQAHQGAREFIPDTAFPRHPFVKGSDAHNQRVAILPQTPGHANDILSVMLPIGIGSNYADAIGKMHQDAIHARL